MAVESAPEGFPEAAGSSEERVPHEIDEVLMGRVRLGDRDALATLTARYWAPLVNYATGFLFDSDSAEDVVLETFVRVWHHRADWVPSGTVSSYFYRITRNLSLNLRRNRQTELTHIEASGGEYLHTVASPTPDQQLAENSLREEVEAAIASLPERRREIFILARFHGLSHQEIAETLGISRQTVSNQMSSALVDLRRLLWRHLHE